MPEYSNRDSTASRSSLLQHRLIAAGGRHNQITLLGRFTGGGLSCPRDCTQGADRLRDSRAVGPGLELGERNPDLGFCQRIDDKQLILLARLQSDAPHLQQVEAYQLFIVDSLTKP